MERQMPPWNASVLGAITDAGLAMMASGAEVSRVEDTVERLARAYGIETIDVVALPTALFVSTPEGTLLRRIRRRSVNLAAMAAINQLSRDVAAEPIGVEEFHEKLAQASTLAPYGPGKSLIFAAGAAGLISQLMGGHLVDILPAAVSGVFTQLVRQRLRTTTIPGSLGDLLAAIVAVFPALAAAQDPIFQPGSILVGGIMILAPGLLLTTAVRDGIAGDLLSAAGRLLEAILVGAAVAAGASLPLYAYLALGGRWP
ncbi:MAG: threonine/serine exporter family protein [Sulfobacillus sp.]